MSFDSLIRLRALTVLTVRSACFGISGALARRILRVLRIVVLGFVGRLGL